MLPSPKEGLSEYLVVIALLVAGAVAVASLFGGPIRSFFRAPPSASLPGTASAPAFPR